MKKLLIFITVLTMMSCTQTFRKYVIIGSISKQHNDLNLCYYVTDTGQLSFYDDCGKFTVGDTIMIVKNKKP